MRLSLPLPLLLLGAQNGAATMPRAAAAQDINSCLTDAGVPIDTKGTAIWSQDILPFNGRLPYTPAAVAVPTTVAQVQAAVSCGAQAGLKVNPKSGGHSYASFGLGGEDGHLVIELDRMYQVTVDSSTNIATVQPGARLGHVATQLYNQGGRAISHGTCPAVGVGGHALHGGYGFSSHTHGLALDWIVGATVVLANSTVVNCSATENTDLFWAIRGAGSSYGVITSFQFNTFAAPSQVTPFTIYLSWQSASDMVNAWTAFQSFAESSMPAELNMRLEIAPWYQAFEGLYHGSASGLQTALSPLLSTLKLSLGSVSSTDWMGGFDAWTYGATVDVTSNYSYQETFYSKSLATTALPSSVIQAASNYWYHTAKANSRDWWVLIDASGGNNSAVAAVPTNATAYVNRDKLFLYEFYDRSDNGTYPGTWAFDFLDDWVDSITDGLNTSQWAMYENYADPTMNRTTAQQNYFRQNLPRLQRIKYAVDPTELFYFPQAIQAIEDAT